MTPVGRLAAGGRSRASPGGVRMAPGSGNEIEAAVERLRSIEEGPRAFFDVVSAGDAAIPALVTMLRGASESVPQPRRLAAEALGSIGTAAAREALVAALVDSGTRRLDPVLRLAEDVVLDAIAARLAILNEHRAVEPLIALLRERPHAGCARALGRLAGREAIPVLVACLSEDFARSPAADALRRLGVDAGDALARALIRVTAADEVEGSSSIQGRCTAADLLGEIGNLTVPLVWALFDRERPVRLHAALALAGRGKDEAEAIAPILLELLEEADWTDVDRIHKALLELGPELIPLLIRDIRHSEGVPRQMRAIELLAATGSASQVASFVDHPQPSVRAAAIRALDRFPEAKLAHLQQHALRDRSAEVRLAALHSLAQRDALPLVCALHLLADRDASVRRRARAVLRASTKRFFPL